MFDTGFARIIKIDGADLLITKEFDEEKVNSPTLIKLEARMNSAVYQMTLNCGSEKQQKSIFKNFNEENARTILNGLREVK